MRFGLVAILTAYFFSNELLGDYPLTLDFSTWYAGASLLALLVGAAVVVFAFLTALGGRLALRDEALGR